MAARIAAMGPSRSLAGAAPAILLCAALVGCDAAPAIPGSPQGSGDPTSGAIATAAPVDPTDPVDTGPLPAPALGSIDDIVGAMADPAMAEQVVVSMLDELGIGLYHPDGTAIRVGTETREGDFYAFEPEVRGLVGMLRARDDPDDAIAFRDLHSTLAGLGFNGSAEQLADAYLDAYAEQPDAPVARLVASLGSIDVDGRLPSLEAWLLVLDGFVPPNGAATAMAAAGDALRATAQGQGGWGAARSRIEIVAPGPIPDGGDVMLRLWAVARSFRIRVQAAPVSVHEGHGALGTPTQVTATTLATAELLTSPFDGTTVVPVNPTGAGVPVDWYGDPVADTHGSLSAEQTDSNGARQATNTYTPRQESAAGQGIDREEPGRVFASYDKRDMLVAIYGTWVAPYVRHLGQRGTTTDFAVVEIGWHEKAEAVIKIVWTDTYDGVDDTITFLGNLTSTEPDPVSGGVMYAGTGTATGSRAGWKACNPGIDVVPSGTVDATFQGVLTGTGSIMISAFADPFTALSGISTAPMEVPIVGGFAQYNSPTVGELCPHSSHGEMTVTMLQLPS